MKWWREIILAELLQVIWRTCFMPVRPGALHANIEKCPDERFGIPGVRADRPGPGAASRGRDSRTHLAEVHRFDRRLDHQLNHLAPADELRHPIVESSNPDRLDLN